MRKLILLFIVICIGGNLCAQVDFNNVIQTVINDYVIDFSKGKTDIESILIIVDDDNSKVDIIDYPYEHLYADIRNKQDSLSSIKIGIYNDLPIKIF